MPSGIASHLQRIIELQRQQGAAPSADIIIETKDDAGPAVARLRISATLPGVDFDLEPVFPSSSGELARFFTLRILRTGFDALGGNPFDLGYDLQDAIDLASVEPVFDYGIGAAFEQPVVDVPSTGAAPEDGEWHLKKVAAEQAWAYSESQGRPFAGAGIIIGQPDTGIAEHVLLRDAIDRQYWKNFLEPGKPPIDPLDGPAAADDASEAAPDSDSSSRNRGHGTAVAGVAASRGHGAAKRIRGAASRALVAPLRCVDGVVIGPWNSATVAQAVRHAGDAACAVVSMSLGGAYAPDALSAAIRYTAGKGRILVAAAGNQVGWVTYPGWDEHCFCVAGTTVEDRPWPSSCNGPAVAASAPAAEIWVAWRDSVREPINRIGLGSGTSYSTAITAGMAALWLAHHGWDNLVRRYGAGRLHGAFKFLARQTARRLSDWPSGWGAGIIDCNAMLRAGLPATAELEPEPAQAEAGRRQIREALRRHGADEPAIAALDDALLDRYGKEIMVHLWQMSLASAGVTRLKLSDHLATALARAGVGRAAGLLGAAG